MSITPKAFCRNGRNPKDMEHQYIKRLEIVVRTMINIFEVQVYIDGMVYGNGQGHSKQAAAKVAAKNALAKIGVEVIHACQTKVI